VAAPDRGRLPAAGEAALPRPMGAVGLGRRGGRVGACRRSICRSCVLIAELPVRGEKNLSDADDPEIERDPMGQAFAQARAAQARGEVPVGAVITRGGKLVAAAGNRVVEDRDPTAHAEILAIRAAARALGSERLTGCDLYVTLEPCGMCAGAISFARLRRLYFAARDPKGGAVESGPRFFAQPTCHHAPDVYGGIRETEAAAMLRGFFAAKRG